MKPSRSSAIASGVGKARRLAAAGLALALLVVTPFGSALGQSPLVAHYTFDDASQFTGGPIIDSSGNGLDGTVRSAITWSASGISGGAMTTSTAPYFSADLSSAGIAADQFSISFWVKTGATSGTYNYNDWGKIDFSNGTTTQTAELRSLPNPSGFYWRDTSVNFARTTPGSPVNLKDNAWHMVTVTVDPTSDDMTVYLDGGNPTVFAGYPRDSTYSLSNLWIGRGSAGGLPGLMDDVQLYSSTLSASDVVTMFANPGLAATGFSTWDAAATDNAWLTGANWSSAAATALPGETANAASTDNRLAVVGDYAFSGGLGIDMSASGANGALALGGISFNSSSGNLRIGNSAADTTGTLRLNGATVGGITNTVLSVSGSSDLTIGDTAAGSGTQTMGVELTAATNVMNVAADRTLTVESAISQSGAGSSIQKTGSGRLVLAGANTYTEGTVISGGTLSVADIADFGSSNIGITGADNSRLSIVGGTLEYTGSGSQSTSRVVWADSGSAEINVTEATGSLTLSPSAGTRSAAFTKSGLGTLTMNGDFSGAATVSVTGGTLALGAANTHSGTTSVASGAALEIAAGDALENSTLSAPAGSAVSFTAASGTSYAIGSIDGVATLDATGSSLAVGGSNASTTYSGSITAASLTKQGSGSLDLRGSNSIGGTTLASGTLIARTSDALGTGAITISGGTLQAGSGTALTNDIQLDGAAGIDLVPFTIEYLLAGGGGGGGPTSSDYPAGGGGGQVLTGTMSLTTASSPIVVGAGGIYRADGTASSAFGLTANPGLAGRNDASTGNNSVGGASGSGFAGGSGYDGGGGGGAAGAGTNEDSIGSRLAGIGGDGSYSSITGTQVGYGGGGAGGYPTGWGSTPRGGQNYGGGGPGVAGSANTGGGGGGATGGGSGVVIVRYEGSPAGTGGVVDTATVPGSTIHSFTDVGEAVLSLNTFTSGLSGVISGTGSLSYGSPNSNLTLSGNNTYSGGTTVNSGTLTVGSVTALGSGSLTVNAGGTVAFDAPSVSSHSLPVVAGAGTLSAAGKTLTFGTGDTSSSFSGTITAAAIAKDGAGQLSLSGSNTIGSTTLTAGTLVAGAGTSLGSGAVTIAGGTLRAVAGTTLTNPITLSANASNATLGIAVPELAYLVVGGGGGPGGGVSGQAYNGGGGGGDVQTGSIAGLSAASFNITVGAGGGLSTAGVSSSAFGITAAGGGEGVATGVGGTSGSGFAGAGKAGVEAGGGGGAGGVGLAGIGSPSGSRIGGNGGPGLPSDITGSTVHYGGGGAGGGGGNGPGTGGIGGGAGRNGDATPNSGGGGRGAGTGFADAAGADGVVIVRYAGGPVATGGTVDSDSVPGYTLHAFTSVGDATLAFTNFATALSGDVTGTGGFTWDSVGSLTLSGSNTYSGGTVVNAGTLAAGSGSAFGSGTITLASGATLDLGGYALSNTITNNGGTILNAGSYAGNQTVDGDATFGDSSGTVAIGNGGVGRFQGQVGGRVEVAAGGVAELDDAASIGGSATFVNDGVLRANRSTDLTIGQPISGTGSFQKQGTGRVVLSAANTYTGGTQIDGGTVIVNGALGTGTVSLGPGTTLGGSGTIAGGLAGSGVVSVGNSPGVLAAATVDPSSGLDWEFEITSTLPDWDAPTASFNDVLRLTDATSPFTSSLTGANAVDFLFALPGNDPITAGSYTVGFFTDRASDFAAEVANAAVEYWVLGEFGSLGDRQQFNVGAGGSAVWYTRLSAYDPALSASLSVAPVTADFGSGNVSGYGTSVVVVPEPGTLALAGLGLAAAAAAFRRRRAF